VTENDRRVFRPVLIATTERFTSWRCGCQAWMQPNDLCRHLAVLVSDLAGDTGDLPAERFEQSMWRAIAFASFSEGREVAEVIHGDPREQLLRKYALTEQEQELLKRGSGSTRLQFEASPWYRWSKEMFLRAGGRSDARLELRDGTFHLRVDDASPIALPPAAVEQVINSAPEIVARSGFEIAPQSLTPSLRIELTSARELRFVPVLLGSGGAIPDRPRSSKCVRVPGFLMTARA
jgi:hypothetical protein